MSAPPRIRRRLTIWYAASALILLLSTVLSMREWARRTLERQNEESTARAVELVRSFFRAELSEYRSVEVTLAHISGELVFAGMGLDFVRPDGAAFAAARPPTGALPLRAPVRVVDVPLDPALAPSWKLRLRISEADLVAARRRIDNATRIILPLAVAMAALVGWLVTGRALRPVAAMADAAERIAGESSGSRLPVANPNDELGRLGRRFNDLLDRLDGTLTQQRRFLADAAHELRTPIARMLAGVELRLGDSPDAGRDRETLEAIHAELGRASSLVDELLQLARADAGSDGAILVPGYLDDVVTDALAAWEPVARRRRIALTIDVLEEAAARIDARLVARLLGVLVDNALRYTPEGGAVRVRVRRLAGRAVLEVEDTGHGIAPSDRAHVFERFYRGAEARRLAPGGSGLGLAIAAWIAHQHGATIEAMDAASGGALMRVTFSPTP